jgi:hypothetical protein
MEYKNKLRMVGDRADTQRGVLLTDGRIISLFNENNQFYLRWDFPIDLETMTYEPRLADESKGEVSLNTLTERKIVAGEVYCYDECIYYRHIYPEAFTCPEQERLEIDRIESFFRDNGYNVSREAIEHNFNSWLGDMKSGYRDDINGYHLFSPCGCNPLSMRLSTLHKLCDDWQQTYTC